MSSDHHAQFVALDEFANYGPELRSRSASPRESLQSSYRPDVIDPLVTIALVVLPAA